MTGDRQKAVRSLIEAMEFAADEDLLIFFLFDLKYTFDLYNTTYHLISPLVIFPFERA